MKTPLILASKSPRRQELLSLLEIPFEVTEPQFQELSQEDLSAAEEVQALARGKGQSVVGRYPEAPILAADTLVSLAGIKMGKPGSPEAALTMIKKLSGRVHEVWTGMYLKVGSSEQIWAECTRVKFRTLQAKEMAEYVATGEPFGKAGAYAIQEFGGKLIQSIEGDYFNVVGLPLPSLLDHLQTSGWESPVRPQELQKYIPQAWT